MNSTLQNQPDQLEDWALQEAARDLTHANSLEQQHEPDLAGNLRDRAGMLIACANAAQAVTRSRTQIGPLDV